MPSSGDDVVLSRIFFLGMSVARFDCNLGLNSAPSTLTVTLVADDVLGQTFEETGNPGQYNSPGAYAELVIESSDENYSDFEFAGLIQGWNKKNDISGTFYSVNLSDPRVVFKNIPIITTFSSYNAANNNNIIDLIGYHNSDPIAAGWTVDGFYWSAFAKMLKYLLYGSSFKALFYNTYYNFHIDDSFTIDPNYVVNLQNPTLDAVFEAAAKDNGLDYYIKAKTITEPGPSNLREVLVTIYGIQRGTQDILSNNEVQQFLIDNEDYVIGYDFGRELRLDPNQVLIFGDNKRSIYTNEDQSSGNRDLEPRQIYNQFSDGNITDRPFISLDHIFTKDNFLDSVFQWPFEKRVLSTLINTIPGIDGYISPPEYTKERVLVYRKGYFVNDIILRAALFSQEAWATAVWYTYKDHFKRNALFSTLSLVDQYDKTPNNLGDHILPTSQVYTDGSWLPSNISDLPETLGILLPPFDRANPNSVFHNTYLQKQSTPEAIAWQEICYQATKEVAEKYYGKQYIIKLPDSDMMNTLSANSGIFEYLRRQNPIEYEPTDFGWYEGSIPYFILVSQTENFMLANGGLKPLIRYDMDKLNVFDDYYWAWHNLSDHYPMSIGSLSWGPSNANVFDYTYLEFDTSVFHPESTVSVLKGSDGFSQTASLANPFPSSNFFLYTSDFNVSTYIYDPRFAIININNPLTIKSGVGRKIDKDLLRKYQDAKFSGSAFVFDEEDHLYGGVCENGYVEFISWLYDSFLITDHQLNLPLTDVSGSVIGLINDLDYYRLTRAESATTKDIINLAPLSINQVYSSGAAGNHVNADIFEYYTPLKYTFLKYGPFSSTLTEPNSAQVIENSSLSPWNYGSYSNMVLAGNELADAAESSVVIQNTSQIELVGYPKLNLGYKLGINSNVSGIQMSWGTEGIKTVYQFKTFIGSPFLVKKREIDQSVLNKSNISNLRKELLRYDLLLKDVRKSKGFDPLTGKSLANNIFSSSVTATNSKNVILTTTVTPSFNNATTVKSASYSNKSKKEIHKEINQNDGSYDHLYTSEPSDLYVPFTTKYDLTHVSSFSENVVGENVINKYFSLHPYKEYNVERGAVPYGTGLPEDYEATYDHSGVRTIGIRGPAPYVGWGYDIYGRKTPAEAPFDEINDWFTFGLNSYSEIQFLNDAEHGSAVALSGYKSGPIDLAWNERSGTWVPIRKFYAKINGYAAVTHNTIQNMFPYVYSWIEAKVNKPTSTTLQLDLETDHPTFGTADGANPMIKNGVFNLNEAFGTTATIDPVATNTLVEIEVYFDRVRKEPLYFFKYTKPQKSFFWAKIVSNQTYGINKWKYGFVRGDWSLDTFSPTGSTTGITASIYAVNTVESLNPTLDPITAPGVNTGGSSYPAGFSLQPITTGTIVKMNELYVNGSTTGIYGFEAYNDHDGTCD